MYLCILFTVAYSQSEQLEKPLPLSFLFYTQSNLHKFLLFIYLHGFAGVATSWLTISSLLNDTYCKVNVGKIVTKVGHLSLPTNT